MDDHRWVRIGVGIVAGGLALVAGCSAGTDSVATVMVDYDHDEFATQFVSYFPDRVQAHPGDTITFRQSWTGEPHTVTLGTRVDDVLEVTRPLIEEYGDRDIEDVPEEVLEEYFTAEGTLPLLYSGPPPEGEGAPPTEEPHGSGEDDAPGGEPGPGTDDGEPPIPQAMAQPCLVDDGELPPGEDPCEERELPPFDGTHAYYNSGIIPYEGPGGNVFELELATDIEPGAYNFYCAVHGSFHSGVLEVLPPDEPVPSPQETSREVRAQLTRVLEPYTTAFTDAQRQEYRYAGEEHEWNYAGLLSEDAEIEGLINEFVPDEITTRVGEPVAWRIFGPHSISFDVPEYFPIVEFLDDGTVRSNEAIFPPAGGAPEVPHPDDPEAEPPSQPLAIDGGTYDGSGFWSTGVIAMEPYLDYTLRFSRPGSYDFACLIHPPMVGTVHVTE